MARQPDRGGTWPLYDFLSALYLEDQPQLVCPDTSRIDQEDTMKRDHQVPVVSAIYQVAKRVRAWACAVNAEHHAYICSDMRMDQR